MSDVVADPDSLERLTEALGAAARVAVDSEGDGYHRYRAQLCTVQVAGGGVEAVVDPLELDDLGPLGELLATEDTTKILHDVSFDAKMLHQRGVTLAGVFDTSVAARFLSEPSTGLAALLEKHLEVEVDKGLQQADWGERPLDAERLGYLLDDVRHLEPLAARLEERAREADILDEIDEETRYAIERALEPEVERAPWTRVKGHRELKGRRLALLAALADAREEEARRRDVPPFRVAPNRALFEAARRAPRTVRDLKRIRGMRKIGASALARAIERAEEEGPPVRPTPPQPSPDERARRKAREKALLGWRATEAERRSVDAQVVLPGHCLRDLVSLDDLDALVEVPGLGAKRIALYRDALVELLRGAADVD